MDIRFLDELDKEEIDKEIDNLKLSGVERNKQAVDILNSKNITASTADSLKVNIDKFKSTAPLNTKLSHTRYTKVLNYNPTKSRWNKIGEVQGIRYLGAHLRHRIVNYTIVWTGQGVEFFVVETPVWQGKLSGIEAATVSTGGVFVKSGSNLHRWYLNGAGGSSVGSMSTRGKMVAMDALLDNKEGVKGICWSAEREIGYHTKDTEFAYSKAWSKNVAEIQTVCEARLGVMTVGDEAGRLWFLNENGHENSNKLQLPGAIRGVQSIALTEDITRIFVAYNTSTGTRIKSYDYKRSDVIDARLNFNLDIKEVATSSVLVGDLGSDVAIQHLEDEHLFIRVANSPRSYKLDRDTLKTESTLMVARENTAVNVSNIGASGHYGELGAIENSIRIVDSQGYLASEIFEPTGEIKIKG